jgi:hypothetical protein
MDEKTLRKHFREELDSGKFKVDMVAGGAIVAGLKSKDERVRLDESGWMPRNIIQLAEWAGRKPPRKRWSAKTAVRCRLSELSVSLLIKYLFLLWPLSGLIAGVTSKTKWVLPADAFGCFLIFIISTAVGPFGFLIGRDKF